MPSPRRRGSDEVSFNSDKSLGSTLVSDRSWSKELETRSTRKSLDVSSQIRTCETPQEALENAIGPDNVPHTTELDTIPCAGIRIPNGPFTGLLAWRFVVRLQDKAKVSTPHLTPATPRTLRQHMRQRSEDARSLFSLQPPPKIGHGHTRSRSQVEFTPPFYKSEFSTSTSALSTLSTAAPSIISTRSDSIHSATRNPQSGSSHSQAVVTNMILDTSSSHNTISRGTLLALGASDAFIDQLEKSETSVSLYLQDVQKPISFRLAAEGEPGRLGVQFLEEARVNICIGEGGRGGIVWADSALETKLYLKEVPRTIPLPKMNIQNKIRGLFNLAASRFT
ncbi:hypothetical protein CC1G_05858 [Coprinopsis cinerea okayama7|uniref:Uncharacterized protein n=1 Tax=Coprinopsis cinerea (strain Okayama-7 / 130 / ATCC MYA-4618 / FGSC 9003) TaxID=240176 RepID=A8NLL7_COPC7|nr:hypothetical protein CC1G_05858 [Coprinopsis cinerea okayama7\|eukprot:XP_001834721.2 hypothetical protein CC1G_05858 [Coprinopsis cinerea okayama7\